MKFLHTMIRVSDLDRSIRFYREGLGFELRTRKDFDKGRFTLAFLAIPGQPGEIELTHNWDRTEPYERGNGYGHVGLGVDSIDSVGERLKAHGYQLSWGPGKTPGGERQMAFVDDPDGYEIELIEQESQPRPTPGP